MMDLVTAYTGMDATEQGVTFYDGVLGVVLLIVVVWGIVFMIKRFGGKTDVEING